MSGSSGNYSSARREQIAALRAELTALFHEDPINLEAALDRVERLNWSVGPHLHASLLLLLLNLTVNEDEGKRIWESFRAHHARMQEALGRPVALRVAALDWLVGQNRATSRPRVLEVIQSHRPSPSEIIDPVTGLHTAGYIADLLPREISRARRFKQAFSIVHLEIDGYASLCESFGSAVGTILLKEVAGIVAGSVRTIDFAARMTAAQYCLLLTETDRMGAYYLAERVRQQVEEFYLQRRLDGRPFAATVSAGVASFPEDAASAEELMRCAQEAWFTARARGTGRVAIHHRERREFIRLTARHDDLQVTLLPEGSDASAQGTMRNISCGGILFESDSPIDLGRMVHVLCRSRRESDQVLIPGRVVRLEQFDADGAPRYEIGVLFDLVVEEQMEGVVEFLERFVASEPGGEPAGDRPSDPPGAA